MLYVLKWSYYAAETNKTDNKNRNDFVIETANNWSGRDLRNITASP
jgi:hypothetical protein